MTTPTITIRPDAGIHTSRAHRSIVVRGSDAAGDEVQGVAPDLGRYILQAAFGEASDRPGLDPRSRELVTIAALATVRSSASELRHHIGAGRDIGLTREEIVETITQVGVPHAGFASAVTGIALVHEVFAEHDAAPNAA
jgi:4-carboxymuconolactone decarboxylase